MKIIIGLVGEQAAGKGTVASYLEEKYGAAKIRFSDSLFDILKRLHLPPRREHLVTLSEILRAAFGEDQLSRVVADDAFSIPNELLVIDGVRRLDDLATLEKLPEFRLIAIEATVEIRYERLKKRGEKPGETELTFEEFVKSHDLPTEKTIAEVARLATEKIINNGSREDLHSQIDSLLRKFGVAKVASHQ